MNETTTPAIAVRAEGVSKTFGSITKHRALDDVSVSFESGSLTGIVGESGSGKSTLARILVGLETPSAGRVSYGDHDLRSALKTAEGRKDMRRLVQFVGQDTTSSFDPRHTLREAVMYPAMNLLGLSRTAASERVDDVVRRLDLPAGLTDRYASQVSGGQRQRFALARALVVGPQMLICDEVVSALDVSAQAVVLNHLRHIAREFGTGLIFVSHGLPATAFVADDLIVMLHGRIVERGAVSEILENPEAEYTRRLLDSYRGPSTSDHEGVHA
ncbi:ABC transporter ATP-binding protein [Agromyces silvae]|uniref:ABC transporter ATP-binding protein n=1 Tax=Agromyces silvae TaxID=3388266 RepID=UPI00280B2A5B|nr:ATP-binding cassette domain-containing protein [Agromyces protaetiae]